MNGGRLSWGTWSPIGGMVGTVVHYWIPNHADPVFRSHVNQLIYLMKISDKYVPVSESGVKEYHQFTASENSVNITPIPSEEEKSTIVEEDGAASAVEEEDVNNADPEIHEEETKEEISEEPTNENDEESTL